MELKKSTSIRVPVRLEIRATGEAVTGVTAPVVYVKKQGSASALKTITNNTNWFEVDATNFPGVYELLLTAGDVDTTGGLLLSVKGGSSDTAVMVHQIVDNLEKDSYDVLVLIRKMMLNRYKLDKTAKTLTIYDDDGTTIWRVFNMRDDVGAGSYNNIFERVPAS